MKGAPNNPLEYAPPVSWHRRSKVRRRVALAISLLIGVWWAPTLWMHARVLWWQWQCLAYTAVGNQIVYDDGEKAGVLIQTEGMVRARMVPMPRSAAAGRSVKCFDRLKERAPYNVYSQPGEPAFYVHAGRDGAKQVLIAVTLGGRRGYMLDFKCNAMRPATPFSSVGTRANSYHLSMRFDATNKSLRIYAGQPDPADPSHFTTRYELDGEPGTIDGCVEAGGSVHLAVRDGPAKGK